MSIRKKKEVTIENIMQRLSGTYRPNSMVYKQVQTMLRKSSASQIDAFWCMLVTQPPNKEKK